MPVGSGAGSGLEWSWRAVWNWVSLRVGMGVLWLGVSGDLRRVMVCWVGVCETGPLQDAGVELI